MSFAIDIINKQKDWPLNTVIGGWCSGWYSCRCRECGEEFIGDKYSFECYPCASKRLQDNVSSGDGI